MLTATIIHPSFVTPSGAFGVVVKKLGRIEAMKMRAENAKRERPFEIRGDDGKPTGAVAWRLPEGEALFWYSALTAVAIGFVNPPNGDDGKPLEFSKDNLWILFDEQYDVSEAEGVSFSFPLYCLREHGKKETFPDPTAAPSATM